MVIQSDGPPGRTATGTSASGSLSEADVCGGLPGLDSDPSSSPLPSPLQPAQDTDAGPPRVQHAEETPLAGDGDASGHDLPSVGSHHSHHVGSIGPWTHESDGANPSPVTETRQMDSAGQDLAISAPRAAAPSPPKGRCASRKPQTAGQRIAMENAHAARRQNKGPLRPRPGPAGPADASRVGRGAVNHITPAPASGDPSAHMNGNRIPNAAPDAAPDADPEPGPNPDPSPTQGPTSDSGPDPDSQSKARHPPPAPIDAPNLTGSPHSASNPGDHAACHADPSPCRALGSARSGTADPHREPIPAPDPVTPDARPTEREGVLSDGPIPDTKDLIASPDPHYNNAVRIAMASQEAAPTALEAFIPPLYPAEAYAPGLPQGVQWSAPQILGLVAQLDAALSPIRTLRQLPPAEQDPPVTSRSDHTINDLQDGTLGSARTQWTTPRSTGRRSQAASAWPESASCDFSAGPSSCGTLPSSHGRRCSSSYSSSTTNTPRPRLNATALALSAGGAAPRAVPKSPVPNSARGSVRSGYSGTERPLSAGGSTISTPRLAITPRAPGKSREPTAPSSSASACASVRHVGTSVDSGVAGPDAGLGNSSVASADLDPRLQAAMQGLEVTLADGETAEPLEDSSQTETETEPQLRAIIAAQEMRIADLQQHVALLAEERAAVGRECDHLGNTVAEQARSIAELQEQVAGLRRALAGAEEALAEHRRELSEKSDLLEVSAGALRARHAQCDVAESARLRAESAYAAEARRRDEYSKLLGTFATLLKDRLTDARCVIRTFCRVRPCPHGVACAPRACRVLSDRCLELTMGSIAGDSATAKWECEGVWEAGARPDDAFQAQAPLVQAAFEGHHAMVVASGPRGPDSAPPLLGALPDAAGSPVHSAVAEAYARQRTLEQCHGRRCTVACSMMADFGDAVHDLLFEVRRARPHPGACEAHATPCASAAQMWAVLRAGQQQRAALHADRGTPLAASHLVLTLHVSDAVLGGRLTFVELGSPAGLGPGALLQRAADAMSARMFGVADPHATQIATLLSEALHSCRALHIVVDASPCAADAEATRQCLLAVSRIRMLNSHAAPKGPGHAALRGGKALPVVSIDRGDSEPSDSMALGLCGDGVA